MCALFLLLFFSDFSSLTVGELLCPRLLTEVVEGTEDGGVLLAKGFAFERGHYEKFNSTHYRVCICEKAACLRKCCPLGQVFVNRSCDHFDLDIAPQVYTSDLILIPDYGIWNFHRVYGSCGGKMFALDPDDEDDEHFLLTNGSLFLPRQNTLHDVSQFCLENVVDVADSRNGAAMTAFVCFPETPDPESSILYPIGMIISMPFLLATFAVYSLPELRNLHGKNLMSHVASLLTAYVVLVLIQLCDHCISDTLCVVFGFLLPYAFLSSFFWLNVMCFDIWSAFSGFGKIAGHVKEKENKRFILYSLYAWGCPLVILIVMVAIQYSPNVPDFIVKPDVGSNSCYFGSKMATLLYFYAPMGCIIVCDIAMFTLTAVKIYKVRKETKVLTGKESRRNDDSSKQRYNLYLKLFLVMGINWVTEIVSWSFGGPREFWYLTDAMNSLQGLFIFWIFVCSRKIKKILSSRFCPKYAARDTETNTSSFKMSTSASYAGDNVAMNNLGGRKSAAGKAI